jgi:hypothetical protein
MNRQGPHRIIRAATKMLGEDTVVIVDPEAVARKLPDVALRPSDAEISQRAQRLLDAVPRCASYAKGPPVATESIERLGEKLDRMRDASLLCGRANRDGTLCRNDRRTCRDHS